MDKLQKCAKAFEKLLEIQYRIVIGRKGKTVELVIGFSKLDFHHLMSLGKLKDLRIAKQNRGSVFDEIITGSTTYDRSVLLLLNEFIVKYSCKILFSSCKWHIL